MDPHDLDILGQLPSLNMYTQICLCFPMADSSAQPAEIVDTLTKGLERLTASFPWVACQVVNEGAGKGNSGNFKLKPFERIPRLVVKDVRHDPTIPTMDNLRRAYFPFSMLDQSFIAPRRALPGGPGESLSDPSPVFLLQATFIASGLLLTFLGQHNTMDVTGQGQVLRLLSKACRNEEFSSEELSSGNLSRRKLIPLFDDSFEPGSGLAHQIAMAPSSRPIEENSIIAHTLPSYTWGYFIFSHVSLVALKSLAAAMVPSGFISTDDALTALVWQSVTRARLPRIDSATEVKFARAVDVRRYLNIPETYPGLIHNMTYHKSTLKKLVDEPLGDIALSLRSAVDPKTSTLSHDTRSVATFLERSPDKSIVSMGGTLDLAKDFMLSSWAKVNCYELDFNMGLGKPEAVRRPRFDPVESLAFFMPKRLDGEIALAICLRDEDMGRLRADEEFMKYGKYIG